MNVFHLFINFLYVDTIRTEDSMLNALVRSQVQRGTYSDAVYTVLNPKAGYAFSQKYRHEPNNKCSHGHMFKHERGQENPDVPSYDDLIKLAPLKHFVMFSQFLSENPKGRTIDQKASDGESWCSYWWLPASVTDEQALAFAGEAHGTGCAHDCSGRPFTRKAYVRRSPFHVLVSQSGGIDI